MTQVKLQKGEREVELKVVESWSGNFWLYLNTTKNGETTKRERQYPTQAAANAAWQQKAVAWAKRGYAVVS